MKLSDTSIRKAKPEPKPYKLFDGKGLFILINPNGNKLWRIVYRFNHLSAEPQSSARCPNTVRPIPC